MQQPFVTTEKIVSIRTQAIHTTHNHNVSIPLHPLAVERRVVTTGYEEYYTPRNFVQLFWGISGTGEILSNDGTYIILEPGDVFWRTPEMPQHLRTSARRWEFRWIAFFGDCASTWVQGYNLPRGGFHAGLFPEYIFNKLESLFICDTPSEWKKFPFILTELFTYITTQSSETQTKGSSNERLARRFVALCRENYHSSRININSCADELGVDRTTLRRIVDKYLNRTPAEILTKLRVDSALRYLRTTRLPVNEVADRSGFSSSAYFCRVIRKATGMTPETYRIRSEAELDTLSFPFED